MPYRKTEWINGETPLNADNMNNIEDGIESLETSLGQVTSQLASKQGMLSSTQLQAVNSGITSTKVTKYDGYQTAINSKMNKLNDSTEIVYDSTNNNLHLAQQVTNKLARALVTPTQTPTEPLLVGLNTSNSQTNIKIGSGLSLENGTLKSSGGGSTYYRHTITLYFAPNETPPPMFTSSGNITFYVINKSETAITDIQGVIDTLYNDFYVINKCEYATQTGVLDRKELKIYKTSIGIFRGGQGIGDNITLTIYYINDNGTSSSLSFPKDKFYTILDGVRLL